jgi:hypothetical protein
MEFAVGIAERSFAVALKPKRRLNNSDTPRKNGRQSQDKRAIQLATLH